MRCEYKVFGGILLQQLADNSNTPPMGSSVRFTAWMGKGWVSPRCLYRFVKVINCAIAQFSLAEFGHYVNGQI